MTQEEKKEEIEILRREVAALKAVVSEWSKFVPPGHYYSPIPSKEDVSAHLQRLSQKKNIALSGIELNSKLQVKFLKKISAYLEAPPFAAEAPCSTRYYFNNPDFCRSDAFLMYGMAKYLRPKRIIEIGSGIQTGLIVDINEREFGGKILHSCICGEENAAKAFLRQGDSSYVQVIEKKIQDVDLDIFSGLKANDILFVDSTHVSKFGSDVNCILFEILPILAKGVYVQFHDIFYPFEYPVDWVQAGRAWNENYLIRAFLQNNRNFEISLFIDYLRQCKSDEVKDVVPMFLRVGGGSMWLRKVKK